MDGERLKLESVKHLRQQSLFQEVQGAIKNRPPTLKEKDWVHITNILLNNAEVKNLQQVCEQKISCIITYKSIV